MKQKQLTTEEADAFLTKLLRETQGVVPPVCLWGQHGIGKTTLVHSLAERWDWPIQVIHPAQFEEMGDLLGLPYQQSENGAPVSQFAPPAWVPRTVGPGILLIDDFNRADDRIIRGLMALLQERRLVSWSLPANWHIILTANPDRSHYSVTPIDDAVLSRMLHLSIKFEHHAWVNWAKGQELPSIGIDFILQHPEQMDGQETTARTFTYFLELWQQTAGGQLDDAFIAQLAYSCLSPQTAQAFLTFLPHHGSYIFSPKDILDDFDAAKTDQVLKSWLNETVPQMGRIS
ncbi:MAG: AAA family ATPase, partial [Bacteroidota bacterium]